MADVKRGFDLLEAQGIKLLALGGHDMSDEVLGLAERRFEQVQVGRTIVIGASKSGSGR
jgi:hypothetical protein